MKEENMSAMTLDEKARRIMATLDEIYPEVQPALHHATFLLVFRFERVNFAR